MLIDGKQGHNIFWAIACNQGHGCWFAFNPIRNLERERDRTNRFIGSLPSVHYDPAGKLGRVSSKSRRKLWGVGKTGTCT